MSTLCAGITAEGDNCHATFMVFWDCHGNYYCYNHRTQAPLDAVRINATFDEENYSLEESEEESSSSWDDDSSEKSSSVSGEKSSEESIDSDDESYRGKLKCRRSEEDDEEEHDVLVGPPLPDLPEYKIDYYANVPPTPGFGFERELLHPNDPDQFIGTGQELSNNPDEGDLRGVKRDRSEEDDDEEPPAKRFRSIVIDLTKD